MGAGGWVPLTLTTAAAVSLQEPERTTLPSHLLHRDETNASIPHGDDATHGICRRPSAVSWPRPSEPCYPFVPVRV